MSMSLKGTEGKMVHPIKTIYFDKIPKIKFN